MFLKKNKITKKANILKIIISIYLIILLLNNENITLMYYNSSNFGDNLNYFLFSRMVDRDIRFYDTKKKGKSQDYNHILKLDKIAKTDLFFIGSMSFKFLNNQNKYKSLIAKWFFKIYDYFHPLIVFGTGFILDNPKKESYVRNLKIIAVRGNITLQRLKRNGIGINNDIILADPGILAPFLINFNNTYYENNSHNLCVIPHEIDRNNKLIYTNIEVKNFVVLNINDNPLKFIYSLLKCKRVLSSSLHGLVVSDSIGIPNMRIIISDKIIGGNYKYEDYYSAYDLKLPFSIDLRQSKFTENDFSLIESNHMISADLIKKKQCQLLKKFPFKLSKQFELIKNIKCQNN